MLKLYWLPTINAAIELNKGNSSQALVYLEAAAPYELAITRRTSITCTRRMCVAKPTCWHTMELPQPPSSRSCWITGASCVNFVTGSLAHLQLGRAYAMAGDTAKAKSAYQDFFLLWKDADPDIPILKQAKAEYAKLQ